MQPWKWLASAGRSFQISLGFPCFRLQSYEKNSHKKTVFSLNEIVCFFALNYVCLYCISLLLYYGIFSRDILMKHNCTGYLKKMLKLKLSFKFTNSNI